MDPATLAALNALISKLVDLGLDRWRRKEEAKKCLAGILSAVRVELSQNWTLLDQGISPGGGVSLTTQIWAAAGPTLGAALSDSSRLLHILEQAYSHGGRPITKIEQGRAALIDIGRALAAIEQFRVAEDLEHGQPRPWECEPPRSFGQLLAGMPIAMMVEFQSLWLRWLQAIQRNQYRPYVYDEVAAVRSRQDPLAEAQFRGQANRDWPDSHCFELERGIYEFWLEPETRVLFTILSSRPVPLDLVRLSGPEVDGWTPPHLLAVARCRQQAGAHL